jgi:hypothetical protein
MLRYEYSVAQDVPESITSLLEAFLQQHFPKQTTYTLVDTEDYNLVVGFLAGLAAAGRPDAQTLLAIMQQHHLNFYTLPF